MREEEEDKESGAWRAWRGNDPTNPHLTLQSDNFLFQSLDTLLVLGVLILQGQVVFFYMTEPEGKGKGCDG